MRYLMCRPDHYGIEYEINPWMNVKHQTNHAKAVQQWETLYAVMQKCGAIVELIEPAHWPDMVFTANGGLYYRNKIILPHFKYKERQGELPFFAAWFKKAGFECWNTITPESPYFEGAGDALLAGKTLFVGFGHRSDRAFYENAPYLDQKDLIYCELTDPYFYHLDTCFCPLNDHLAMWYPDAFTPDSQARMQAAIELIAVNEVEAKRFACNAVVLDKFVVMPANCPDIALQLEKQGFMIKTCEMDEYLKAGGACKCLTLRLDEY